MQDRNINIRPQQQKQQDPIDLIKKSTHLLWKKKLWIILITLLVSVLWILLAPFLIKAPEYSATTLIKFDDPRRSRIISAVTDFAQEGTAGKVALLYTNSLLTSVVDSLKLNLRISTKGISRFSFFKDIKIKENLKYGSYNFVLNNKSSEINLFYSNKKEEIEDRLIFTKSFNPDSDIVVNVDSYELLLRKVEAFFIHSTLIALRSA